MQFSRRRFLHLTAAAAALSTEVRATALSYPERPVHMLIGFPAGLGIDIYARLLASPLSKRLGQQFIVDNRPGAGSNIATEALVRALPDGQTLLFAASANAFNASLYQHLNFDFVRDTAAVASVSRAPFVMVIAPNLPITTVPEFIAYAKANPGKINMASPGIGTANHVFGEQFKIMTGTDLVHVPYRTSFMPDLLSGQVQMVFIGLAPSLQLIRTGKLRPLAVTTASRVDILPDVPAVSESVPGYEASAWNGIVAPKNTPTEVIHLLNASTNAAISETKQRFLDLGVLPAPMTPGEFGKFIVNDTAKWAKVIRFANIRTE